MNGRSKETLVFLHGFGGGSSAYKWSKVYPAFAAEYQILAPDLIGWGRSVVFGIEKPWISRQEHATTAALM